MIKHILKMLMFVCLINALYSQKQAEDTSKIFKLSEVIVTTNKTPVILKNNPNSVTLVTSEVLSIMPKTIGTEEALRLVPGVRIDNQHDGERVHISIRGQGILTERGVRGISVLLDGIPLNDPSGFVPDLYDVEWASVNKIEVLKGPAGSLYGGSSSGGVINIFTNTGGNKPINAEVSEIVGSNGFFKTFLQLNGSKDDLDYRVSYSRTDGDGYRDHQAFWGNKLYEKISYHPTKELSLSQIFAHTDYFQQNPEGLNLEQFDNLRQANPDALPFNEYQKTNRNTFGINGKYEFNENHDIELISYLRAWNYKETSNKCAEYRTISNPGVNFQYNLHLGSGNLKNHISVGTEWKWQNILMYKLQSASDTTRKESIDETNIETKVLLANQIISQQSAGVFAIYKFEYNNFLLIGNARYDVLNNELTDKMLGLDTAKTEKNFSHTSLRLSLSYDFDKSITAFANWSQGFTPPSTEELASNPIGYSGFNTHLIPATSNCFELGARGIIGNNFYYEITGFFMKTENDFFRFKQTGRGNQEVFYGNAGNSERKGVEILLSYNILKNLSFQIAYTFSDYTYTSATIDPIYKDTNYVLTTPPEPGQWLPNSPKHQLYAELVYSISDNLKIILVSEYQSKWAIYTDAKAYKGELDPKIFQNWQDGFNLYNASISYQFKIWDIQSELSIFARNFTGQKYMAFTEPDPDGNSYHPGPVQEFFGNLKIKF